MISWGHDEVSHPSLETSFRIIIDVFYQYLYQICKAQSTLPPEALAMIRYHSFYPWHREGAYRHLMETKEYVFSFF